MTTTKTNRDQTTLLLVIAIGGLCSFGGEISGLLKEEYAKTALAFSLMPPFAFIVLRAYVVMLGKRVREQMGKPDTANFWTAVCFVCGAVYIYYLQRDGTIELPLMWSLQAVNLIMIPAEIYYGIISADHPSVERIEKLESKIEELESEIGLSDSQIEKLETEIEAKKKEIATLESEITSAELKFGTDTIALNAEIEEQRTRLEVNSERVRNSLKLASMKNMRACACPECGTISMWGIATKGNVICTECDSIVKAA